MIPLRDSNPTRRFPIVTVALIGLNVAAFLIDRATATTEVVDVLTPYGIVRAHRFVGGLAQHYALIPGDLVRDMQGAWLTAFTSMFLHANWLHIGGNMLYLWIFGNNVEDSMGRLRFLVFYLMTGIIASIAQVLTGPNSRIPTVGASGAIAGVLGAYIVLFPTARVQTLLFLGYFARAAQLPALVVLGFWFVLQLFNGLLAFGVAQMGGVAWFAHIGGFVSGLLLVRLFTLGRRPNHWDERYR